MKNEDLYTYGDLTPEWEKGLLVPRKKVNISIEDAKTVLENAMKHYLSMEKKGLSWLSEYDQVADWLKDNKGKGLFLFGACGRGKSLLTRYVIPAILSKYIGIKLGIYEYWELNPNLDRIIGGRITDKYNNEEYLSGISSLCIDDIGPESDFNQFGNKRIAFAEIMDSVEKESKLIIISTNLNKDGLLDRYGARVFDRIISTTRRIEFKGESLRK